MQKIKRSPPKELKSEFLNHWLYKNGVSRSVKKERSYRDFFPLPVSGIDVALALTAIFGLLVFYTVRLTSFLQFCLNPVLSFTLLGLVLRCTQPLQLSCNPDKGKFNLHLILHQF